MIRNHSQTVTVRLNVPKPTAQSVLEACNASLHPTARNIFTLLFETVLATLQAKGHALTASQYTIHQPVEIICEALEISRVTFYKHLATLKGLGLVYSRAHTGDWFGLARKTGTLFAVALKPFIRARIGREEYAHNWRDLQADTQRVGRTAYSFLQSLQSRSDRKDACITALKAWAVNPGTTEKPVNYDCKGDLTDVVYSLETLPTAHYSERPKLIDSFATALAKGFTDSCNLNFWRKLLWNALKRESEGLATLYKLTNALTRLQVDVQEWQGLKSPGALLVHRLKASGIWDELAYT